MHVATPFSSRGNTSHLAEHGNRWDTADRHLAATGLIISVFRCRLQILYPRQSIRSYTLMPLAEVCEETRSRLAWPSP